MNDYEKLREEILGLLTRDLYGPYSSEDEVLEEMPLLRYTTGVIYPQGAVLGDENDDGGQGQESQTNRDDSEQTLALSNVRYPSCYGITFTCRKGVSEIGIYVSAGSYHEKTVSVAKENRNDSPKEVVTPCEEGENNKDAVAKESADASEEKANNPVQSNSVSRKVWERKPINWFGKLNIGKYGESRFEIIPNFSLRARIRPPDKYGDITVTISLVNENRVSDQNDVIERCRRSFFQAYFAAQGKENERPFVDKKKIFESEGDMEKQTIQLLYRNTHSFATGHGCSAAWADDGEDETCRVESAFVPIHLIYPMRPPQDLGLPDFNIKNIAEGSKDVVIRMLGEICGKYTVWIHEELEARLHELPPNLTRAAEQNIKLCKETETRIRRGIDILSKDKDVFSAFQLAHHAMMHQFARTEWFKLGKPADINPACDNRHKWYPFQIAFILQCIESLADSSSSDRDIVDLLWFPTGGGKTEAYLGLIAFILFLRRLRGFDRDDKGGGTAALMRYTLRLLTVDQFYRAALLACSCETVRNDKYICKKYDERLANSAKISIGLWVGGEAAPNTLDQAEDGLKKLKVGNDKDLSGNPVKLTECPWCGHTLGPADYAIPDKNTGMIIRCPGKGCTFSKGLPVWIVDEDVYRERPSLIIGTVDKFARIPWVEESGNIFGSDGKTAPPELIIQDELHLISGPLGTMVGLYETAVDILCCDSNGKGPKMIASTATIRNSSSQVNALYCREVRQFPPSGIDYSNSFFAKEDRSEPGRLYAGVFTPGTSPTTALVRTFGCLLHGAHMSNDPDNIKDPYWTLLGYFNSLRELGGARTQVEDDVNDYLKFCAERDGDKLKFRKSEMIEELTSRVKSSVLDDVRSQLRETLENGDALDVVLASNMISVGLDVTRLGLMSIIGQPKSTSEYIQASSRIGRKYPGLVVTVYNWTRSRDRSHYERFKSYHGRLYSEVEATSVTPFSSRARDRGLHAVFITLVRNLVKGMRRNDAATDFDPASPEVAYLIEKILERVEQVDPLELNDTKRAIEEIVAKWKDLCAGGLPYSDTKGQALLKSAEDATKYSNSFPTLNSLRNIDPAAGLYLEV